MIKIIFLSLFLFVSDVFAWEPTRPVVVTIAYSPGSGNELLFRKAASIINRSHNINFVIEFKPGANEVVGTNYFDSNARNDGHSLFVPAIGVWIANPAWYKKILTVDVMKFEPVVNLGETSLALYTHYDNPIDTPTKFVTMLKSGKNTTIGTGAAAHVLAYQYIINQSKTSNTERIQYTSPSLVAQAVASKEIEYGITPLSMALEWEKAKKIKIIGVTALNRTMNKPKLDTVFPGLDLVGQVGIVVPNGTNQEIINYWNKLFSDAVKTKEYQSFLDEISWQHTIGDYRKFIGDMRNRWLPIAEALPFN